MSAPSVAARRYRSNPICPYCGADVSASDLDSLDLEPSFPTDTMDCASCDRAFEVRATYAVEYSSYTREELDGERRHRELMDFANGQPSSAAPVAPGPRCTDCDRVMDPACVAPVTCGDCWNLRKPVQG